MQGIELNTKHTTQHARYYSGNLRSLLSYEKGGIDKYDERIRHLPHHYVDVKKLRQFLIKEKIISKDEYNMGMAEDVTNGVNYWLFFSDLGKHRRKVREIKRAIKEDEMYPFAPQDPADINDNDSGLVASAYIVNQRKEGISPRANNSAGMLEVKVSVQFKPDVIEKLTKSRFAHEQEDECVADVLTDLRSRFHETTEPTNTCLDFGHFLRKDFEGVNLRVSSYDTARWAQKNMLSSFKKILSSPEIIHAILLREDMETMDNSLSAHHNCDDKDKIKARKIMLNEKQDALKGMKSRNYTPLISKAANKFAGDKTLIECLRLI